MHASAISDKTHRAWLALWITAIWLLHPAQVSTVLYTVQRMAQLSALFCFTAAALYVRGRLQLRDGQARGWRAVLLAILAGTPLALLSKENGALLPTLLLIIEVLWFRFRDLGSVHRATALRILLIGPTLAILAFLVYLVSTSPLQLPNRSFNLPERLMTESRVLWFYLRLWFVPDPAAMGLFHDDYLLSKGLWQPWTTLVALLGWLLVFLVACFGKFGSLRIPLCFAVFWYVLGHLLESMVIPLELVFEHRNYLPIFGVLFATVIVIDRLSVSLPFKVGTAVVLLALLSVLLQERVDQWSSPGEFLKVEAANHPYSPRLWGAVGSVYNQTGYYEEAHNSYQVAAELNPREIGYRLDIYMAAIQTGAPKDADYVAAIQAGLLQYVPTAYTWSRLYRLIQFNADHSDVAQSEFEQLLQAVVANPDVEQGEYIAPIYYALGQLQSRRGDWSRAIEYWQAGIAAHASSHLRIILADAYLRRGELAAADQQLQALQPGQLDQQQLRQHKALLNSLQQQSGNDASIP